MEIRIAGVLPESAFVVTSLSYKVTVPPPPSIRILPLPALIALSVTPDSEIPKPVNEIVPPAAVKSASEPKVKEPLSAVIEIGALESATVISL